MAAYGKLSDLGNYQPAPSATAFYGWYMVAALWSLEFLNMGFPFYGGAVINTYMLHHIPMDRSTFGLGFTIFNIFVGAPSALIVASILRWGLRATFVLGSALICAGALWMSFFVTHPWQYVVGFGVLIGTGVGFGTIVPISTGVTRWFRRYRGRAMAIAFCASGFAGLVGAPLLNHILAANGGNFQQAWLIVAAIALLAGILAWLFIKESPEALGQHIDGLTPEALTDLPEISSRLTTSHTWTAGEAYRTPAFWMIVLGAMACQFPFFFFNAHALLHMKAHGVSAADAAWAMGVFTGVGILGRFLGGWLLERIPAQYVFILGLAGYVAGSLLAIRADAGMLSLAFSSAACFGFAFGCSWVALNTITGNFFGIAAFPKLNGTVMISTAFTCAPAGVIGGMLFDRYNTYTPAFELNIVLCIVGIAALMFARMPTPRATTAQVSA
jgi:MFS family permease